MKRPVAGFVLALVSLILCPILVSFEFAAAFFAAMVESEPTNPALAFILSLAVVIVIGLAALALPLIAVMSGALARKAAKSTASGGAGLATAAIVIGGLVIVGVLVSQVYLVLMAAGACGLDGC